MRKSSPEAQLDRIDFALLHALQQDGRRSNKELAAMVGLAPSSCLQRVKRLRDSGVLRGVHADIDPHALGIHLQALVSIRMRSHDPAAFERFYEHLATLPEVTALYRVAGADDFLLHVGVRDAEHLLAFTMTALTSRPEVDRVQTTLIFDYTRADAR